MFFLNSCKKLKTGCDELFGFHTIQTVGPHKSIFILYFFFTKILFGYPNSLSKYLSNNFINCKNKMSCTSQICWFYLHF